MRAPVTLAIILSFSTLAHAQQVEKCCGTSSSTFLLGSPAYARHTQCLYAPGELTGAVVGQIHRLYYRYGNSGVALGNTLGNITISMVQTNATSFTGVNFLTGLQTVFQADSLTIAPGVSGDWFNFNLDALFNFDPSLSLVVDIRWETSANSAFGTMSVGNTTGRKIMSPDPSSPTGEAWNTLQDIGFDLAIGSGIAPAVFSNAALFPNPAEQQASLTFPNALTEPATLTVLDPVGRSVLEKVLAAGSSGATLDLRTLQAGAYLLVMQDASGRRATRRLVRQ